MKTFLLLLSFLISVGLFGQNPDIEKLRQYYNDGTVQHEWTEEADGKKGIFYYYNGNKQLIKKVEYVFTYKGLGNYEGFLLREKIAQYSSDGSVISIQEFENGRNISNTLNTYPNGQIRSEIFPDPDGTHVIQIGYYETGKIQYKNRYIENGKKRNFDGLNESYHSNGRIRSSHMYNNGIKEGPYLSWNENGVLLDEFIYKNDTAIYIKRFNQHGVPTSFWSKDSPVETHFNKQFYPGDSILQSQIYRKKMIFDTLLVILKFSETYDRKGKLISSSVSDNREGVNTRFYYGTEALASDKQLNTNTFNLYKRGEGRDTVFRLMAGFRVEQLGFYINNDLKFQPHLGLKDQMKIIDEALSVVRKNVTESKVNETHMIEPHMFDSARIYYQNFPQKVIYSKAVISSSLDSTMTGNYRIDFVGTEMFLTATLREGLHHGTARLYLNKDQLLYERNFLMGYEHGRSRDWFIDGRICSDDLLHFGRMKESYLYYSNGQVWKHEVFNQKNMTVLKEVWRKDGLLLEFISITDTLNRSLRFNKDGTFQSYGWNDLKNKITLSRTLYKDRYFASITIPHIPGVEQFFKVEHAGIIMEGKAYWDPVEKRSVLVDKFGELAQFDRSVISYPQELPCTCQGWEDYEFFAQATNTLIDEKEFLKYQHNFHQPLEDISFIFGNPYSINQKPDEYKFGRHYDTYSNFFSPKPLVLNLPDSNGIQLVVEPCKSRFAFIRFDVSTSFKIGYYKETTATFHKLKHVAIRFPKSMMTQVDQDFKPLFDSNGQPFPGMFMFSAKELKYDQTKEINVTYPSFMYGRYMLMGKSGIILDAGNVFPDFSSTENYPKMNSVWAINNREKDSVLAVFKIPKQVVISFRGAYIDRGNLFLPVNSIGEMVNCSIESLSISADQFFGEISIPVTLIGTDLFSIRLKNGTKKQISIQELVRALNTRGIRVTNPIYRAESQLLTFYLYYKSK